MTWLYTQNILLVHCVSSCKMNAKVCVCVCVCVCVTQMCVCMLAVTETTRAHHWATGNVNLYSGLQNPV